MDQVGEIIWEIVKGLCGRAKSEADYIYDFQENLESLKGKWEDLLSMKKDLNTRVDDAENTGGSQRAHQINRWLKKVDDIQQEITTTEAQGAKEIQNKCLYECCPKNCKSSYWLGKKATKMLKDVDQLVEEGKRFSGNFNIAHKIPSKPIEMPQDEVVGLDLIFDEVWKSIEEKSVGIIGLYGMGGVGKTTLLMKINNELGKRRLGFDFVIWAFVSKEPDLDSVMDNIRESVGIEDDIWKKCNNHYKKAAKIYEVLKKKKFILLLDDIWDKLDLKSVGVPHPKDTNFQSKVLFTTRLEDVCAKMEAKPKFMVEILTEEQALQLFRMKVGEETLSSHPNIPKLAEKMAKECKRLPLALIVVGSAMAGVKGVGAWEHSINSLISSSWTGRDLETKVFSTLKFSYDNLDEVEKCCFLYCALYPENCEILVPDLIDKWMWEKLLCKDMTMSVQNMHSHGESIIEKLKLSCLLESAEDNFLIYSTVKMHDMIRDMALWLLKQGHDNMELAKRILILNDWELEKILYDPLNVTTLVLLKGSFHFHVTRQLEDVKCMMKRLKVLELHVSGKGVLDMTGLISLEYLSFHVSEENLGPEFWINFHSLTNLKFLSFQKKHGYVKRWKIPLGVLSSLQQLRVFRLFSSKIIVSEDRKMLEELESLPKIEELWIKINSRDGLNKLLGSNKLQRCIYKLSICVGYLNEIPVLISLRSLSGIKQLQQIVLQGLYIKSDRYSFVIETDFLAKLQKVEMDSCSVSHVTWLKYAPLLQELFIDGCESIEEVIKEEEAIKDENVNSCVFSSLVMLTLSELPSLKSIHKAPLPFPSLKSIFIKKCPKLKKLPFHSNTTKHKLGLIKGQQHWWDSLEWDEPTAKLKFQLKFENLDDDVVFTIRD